MENCDYFGCFCILLIPKHFENLRPLSRNIANLGQDLVEASCNQILLEVEFLAERTRLMLDLDFLLLKPLHKVLDLLFVRYEIPKLVSVFLGH